jgi:hypothetical protein
VAGPYQRVAHGDRANDGSATDAAAVVNSMQVGIEDLEEFRDGGLASVTDYGVVADCKTIRVETRISGQATNVVKCRYSPYAEGVNVFTNADIGKIIHIDKADSAGNYGWHRTTIASVPSGNTPGDTCIVTTAPTRATDGIPSDGQTTFTNCVFGTDNTANINTAIADVVARDDLYGLFWPGSAYHYYTNGNHVILNTRPIALMGAEQNTRSSIVTTHQTNNLFWFKKCAFIKVAWLSVTHAAKMCEDVDYHGGTDRSSYFGQNGNNLLTSAPSGPTAGSAFKTGDLTSIDGDGCYGAEFDHVYVSGFWNGLELINLSQVRVRKCGFYSNRWAHVLYNNPWFQDWGGIYLYENFFSSSDRQYLGQARYGFRWENGGGIAVMNNEFAGDVESVSLELQATQPYSSTAYGTSQLRIMGNSFEDWGDFRGIYTADGLMKYAIRLNMTTAMAGATADFFNAVISGNNLAAVMHGGTDAIGVLSSGNGGRLDVGKKIGAITTTGNTGYISGKSVTYTNVLGGAVGMNYLKGATTQFQQTGCVGIIT